MRHNGLIAAMVAVVAIAAGGCVLPQGVSGLRNPDAKAATETHLAPTPTVPPSHAELVSNNSGGLAPQGATTGTVLNQEGLPAPGIPVRAYLVSNSAAHFGNVGGVALFRIQAASGSTSFETSTDARGRFAFTFPDSSARNIEAILADDVRAIRLGVSSEAKELTLRLAFTGAVSGRVTAKGTPSVTNFEGVDVFIPGTTYVGKADKTGQYTLGNVAAGTFSVVGTKAGLGRGTAAGLIVEPRKTAQAPDIDLALPVPRISLLRPAIVSTGNSVEIRGKQFGASTGDAFEVRLGGAIVEGARRTSDEAMTFDVPPNARSGDVVVSIAGIPSGSAKLSVAATLAIDQPYRTVRSGTTRVYTATMRDADGIRLSTEDLQWRAQGPLAISAGAVTGNLPGEGELYASLGGLTASVSVHVAPSIGVVRTVAGTGFAGLQDGAAADAAFKWPAGLLVDPDGTILVGDTGNNAIRAISPDGRVRTLVAAGMLVGGRLVKDFYPRMMARDAAGVLWLPDSALWFEDSAKRYSVIRTLTGEGNLETPFENAFGFADGGTTEARFSEAWGIASNVAGGLFITDTLNNRIRKLDPVTRQVTTLAGSGDFGWQDGPGNLARFAYPAGIAVAPSGTLIVADEQNNRIRTVSADGRVKTLAGDGQAGFRDGPGDQARFNLPRAVAVDAQGRIYVADSYNHAIRQIDPTGDVTTIAGSGNPGFSDGVGTQALFQYPVSLAVDASGDLYVTDANHRIRVIR